MKRLVSFLLALAMLCTLVPSAFAADTTEANSYRLPETYHFTVDDEPAEIYETLLRDYGKKDADSYKYALLVHSGATGGAHVFNIDDYELGPKDQYLAVDRQSAINYVANLIDPATVGPKPDPDTATTGATGNYYFTVDDDPVMIYVTLFRNNGEQAANHYKSLILEQDYRETHNLVPDAEITEVDEYGFESRIDFKNNFYSLDPEKQYSETVRQAGIHVANSNNDPYFDPEKAAAAHLAAHKKKYSSPESQIFADVAPGAWYYEAVNVLAGGGLLTGYDDGLFHPDDPVTYAQWCALACKIYKIRPENEEPLANQEHWAQPAMYYLVTRTNQMFWASNQLYQKYISVEQLDVPMRRGKCLDEMVVLFVMKYYHSEPPVGDKVWTWEDIPDADICRTKGRDQLELLGGGEREEINRWAIPHILRAYNFNITSGVDETGRCDPLAVVTRAQLCQLLYNMEIVKPFSSVTYTIWYHGLFGGSSGDLAE